MLSTTCRCLVCPSGRRNLFPSISSFPRSEDSDAQRGTESYIYSPGELRRLGTDCRRSPIDGTAFNLLGDCRILRSFRGCRAGRALNFRNHVGSLNIQTVHPAGEFAYQTRHDDRVCHAMLLQSVTLLSQSAKIVGNLVPLLR